MLATGKLAKIYVAYLSTQKNNTKILQTIRYVQLLPIEPFLKGQAPLTKSQDQINYSIPFIVEYLLVEHGTIIYIDSHYMASESTIPKVLEMAASYGGQVLVPTQEYIARGTRLDSVQSLLSQAGSSFALFVVTRDAFVENFRKELNWRRGITTNNNYIDGGRTLRPGRTIRQSAIALHRHSGRKSNQKKTVLPLLAPLFTFRKPHMREQVKQSRRIKVGLGLDLDMNTTNWGFILRSVLGSVERQSSSGYLVILYLIPLGKSVESNLLSEILDQNLRLPIAVSTEVLPMIDDPQIRLDLVWTIALQDGCNHFYHFGSPPVIPRDNTNWITTMVRMLAPQIPPLYIVTVIRGEDEIWMLKELIGSIHGALEDKLMAPPPLMIVVGMQLSSSTQAMIKLWHYVEYLDLQELLFGHSQSPIKSEEFKLEEYLERYLIISILVERYGHVLYWDARTFLEGTTDQLESIRQQLINRGLFMAKLDILNEKDSMVLEGYDRNAFREVYPDLLDPLSKKESLILLKDYKRFGLVPEADKTFHIKSSLPKPIDPEQRSQMYCHLSLRQEIMYTPSLFPNSGISQWAHSPLNDSKLLLEIAKIKIAILIPSKNPSGQEPKDSHLLQTFLKSMISSVTADEWNRFTYTLYVGYDKDDPILDLKRSEFIIALDQIIGLGHRMNILVKFVRLPTIKCVTMLWNVLFIEAVSDGNDYFYQVNDDVSILQAGWSTKFVEWLRSNDDFGVAGPNDQLWQCRLLTQSFVSRKHYEIFHWYFPTIIKDWYSDNWISQVYGTLYTRCFTEFGIKNGASGTRYNICNKPKWLEAVTSGQKVIQEWKARQTMILAETLKE